MKTDLCDKMNDNCDGNGKKSLLVLAPMAGFTDAPFRLLCRRLGADYCVSEMISAAAMCFGDRKTALLSALPAGDAPCAVQLFGHDEKTVEEAASRLASGDFEGCRYGEKPSAIDVNMGCPVKKVVSSGDGSALMRDPVLAARIAAAAVRGAGRHGVPVSVKIRAGWDKDSINAPEIARRLAAEGVAAIAVHARTREQMYAPGVDLSVIRAVREAVPREVRVIGNGDVASVRDALAMLDETGCDGVMVGRAALGNPWIFGEIRASLENKPFSSPDTDEIIDTALGLATEIVAALGEDRGVRESRGRIAHFIRGMRGSAAVRGELNRAGTLADITRVLRAAAGSAR